MKRIALAAIAAMMVVLVSHPALFELPFLNELELMSIDYRFQTRGVVRDLASNPDVIILEISDDAIKALPKKFPWPYNYYAHLITNLERAGAKIIAFDIIWDTPAGPEQKLDYDSLWNVIHRYRNIVLSGRVDINIGMGKYSVKKYSDNYNNIFYGADSLIGIVNIRNDRDGIFRRYQPFTYINGKQVPTFSIAVLKAYYGIPADSELTFDSHAFHFQNHSIPNSDGTSTILNYYGPTRTFKYLQFSDVMDDHEFKTRDELTLGTDINTFDDSDFGYLKTNIFKNKIILVGSSLPEFKDLLPVPLNNSSRAGDNLTNGVEVHATMVQNVLDGFYIQYPPPWIEISITFLLGFLIIFGVLKIAKWKTQHPFLIELAAIIFLIAFITGLFFGTLWLFIAHSILAQFVGPCFTIVSCYLGASAYRYYDERKQKLKIKEMWGHYLSPVVVNEIIADPKKLRLGGEQRELTVLFSDIEEFTTFSEKITPEELVTVLNEYLNAMMFIIMQNNGTFDKSVGDAIMAFWGAPIPQKEHAINACLTALEMQLALISMREKWIAEGKSPIKMRVGINTGLMVVGNMGGAERFNYTVMGDSVNLGSRLEGANKQYGTSIMISESTYLQAREYIRVRELDLLVVKGKTEPIRVYELIGKASDPLPEKKEELLQLYHEGLALYRQRKFKESEDLFTQSKNLDPTDFPSQLYRDRSRLYVMNPPPEDWNGVFVMRTK